MSQFCTELPNDRRATPFLGKKLTDSAKRPKPPPIKVQSKVAQKSLLDRRLDQLDEMAKSNSQASNQQPKKRSLFKAAKAALSAKSAARAKPTTSANSARANSTFNANSSATQNSPAPNEINVAPRVARSGNRADRNAANRNTADRNNAQTNSRNRKSKQQRGATLRIHETQPAEKLFSVLFSRKWLHGNMGLVFSFSIHLVLVLLLMFLAISTYKRQSITIYADNGNAEDPVAHATFEIAQKAGASMSMSVTNEFLDADLKSTESQLDAISSGSGFYQGDLIGDAPSATFFGAQGVGRRFVIIIDKSGSMSESTMYWKGKKAFTTLIEIVKTEATETLDSLTSEQEIHVCFFDSRNVQMLNHENKLLKGSVENVEAIKKWFTMIRPTGSTDPTESIERALQMSPDAVFLLSDGAFGKSSSMSALEIVQSQNSAIPFHCISLANRSGATDLKQIAEATGGTYRHVATGPESFFSRIDIRRKKEAKKLLKKLMLVADKIPTHSQITSINEIQQIMNKLDGETLDLARATITKMLEHFMGSDAEPISQLNILSNNDYLSVWDEVDQRLSQVGGYQIFSDRKLSPVLQRDYADLILGDRLNTQVHSDLPAGADRKNDQTQIKTIAQEIILRTWLTRVDIGYISSCEFDELVELGQTLADKEAGSIPENHLLKVLRLILSQLAKNAQGELGASEFASFMRGNSKSGAQWFQGFEVIRSKKESISDKAFLKLVKGKFRTRSKSFKRRELKAFISYFLDTDACEKANNLLKKY